MVQIVVDSHFLSTPFHRTIMPKTTIHALDVRKNVRIVIIDNSNEIPISTNLSIREEYLTLTDGNFSRRYVGV